MKVFVTSSLRCAQLFGNLTKNTQIHYLNYTLETRSRDHLSVFFESDLEAIFKLKSYKLDSVEVNYKQDLLNQGEKMSKLRETLQKDQPPKKELIIPEGLTNDDILKKIEVRKQDLKAKVEKIEAGTFLHYSVVFGAIVTSLPAIFAISYCCPAKGNIDWEEKIEELKKEVKREEQIFDKELKKVMDQRKSLEASVEKLEGGKFKISDILEGKHDPEEVVEEKEDAVFDEKKDK